MSYCVNCGVELDASSKKCVLCQTPVYFPQQQNSEQLTRTPFPDNVEIPKTIQRRFVAYVITMFLLVPNIVLFFVNVFFANQSAWCLYFISVSLQIWTLFVFPFFTKKLYPFLMWASDTVVTGATAFLFIKSFVEDVSKEKMLLKIVLSTILLVAISALVFIIWARRRKHHWTAIVAHILMDLTVTSFIVGSVATVLSGQREFMVVGIICFLCFLSLFGFFIYCNRSKRIRAWLNKSFYI